MALVTSNAPVVSKLHQLEKTIEESNKITTKQNAIMIWLTIAIFALTIVNVVLMFFASNMEFTATIMEYLQ